MNKIESPKLIPINGGKEGRIKVDIKQNTAICRHWNVNIDEKNRSISCRKCGTIIDPFGYLLQWAEEERQTELNLICLKQDEKRLKKGIEELRAEEKRIKARIRNAKKG